MSSNSIFKGTFVLCVFYLSAKLISFLVETLIASNFGAGVETDSYYLADSVILAITPMLTIGIWKVFMPEYKRLAVLEKKEEAEKLTGNLLVVFFFISLFVSVFIIIFSDYAVMFFAPGFNSEKLEKASCILQFFAPIFVVGTIATIPSAILQAQSQFSKSQIKEIIIFSIPLSYLVFYPNLNVETLALCLLAGNIMAMLIQFILLRTTSRIKFDKKILTPNIISLLKLYPVACLNSAILQLNSVIDKMFCSSLSLGAITFLNYGTKVINLFNGIFSTTISVAVFPHIAEIHAIGDKKKMSRFISNYLSVLLGILTPFSIFLAIYSVDIISLLFGYGKFDTYSVGETAGILRIYAIGLTAMGITTSFNDLLYINKKVRQILYTTIINIVSNIILDILFINSMGVQGLCLATTMSLFITLFFKYKNVCQIIDLDYQIILNLRSVLFSTLLSSVIVYVFHSNFSVMPSVVTIICGFLIMFTVYFLYIYCCNKYYRLIINNTISKLKIF